MTNKDFMIACIELGMNGKQIAETLGVSPVTISCWKNNKRKIPKYIEKLINYEMKNRGLA